jgi:hypothetical protein
MGFKASVIIGYEMAGQDEDPMIHTFLIGCIFPTMFCATLAVDQEMNTTRFAQRFHIADFSERHLE